MLNVNFLSFQMIFGLKDESFGLYCQEMDSHARVSCQSRSKSSFHGSNLFPRVFSCMWSAAVLQTWSLRLRLRGSCWILIIKCFFMQRAVSCSLLGVNLWSINKFIIFLLYVFNLNSGWASMKRQLLVTVRTRVEETDLCSALTRLLPCMFIPKERRGD